MRIEHITAKDLFDDCLVSKAAAAGERRVALEARLDDAEATLGGDRRLLGAAVNNLIVMAIARCRPGGRIVMGYHRDAARESIVVADNGSCIPYEELRSVRDIFSRAGMTRECREDEGGIALQRFHVVKDIADIHNGRVGVRSVEGEGTTFTLHLPCNRRGAA